MMFSTRLLTGASLVPLLLLSGLCAPAQAQEAQAAAADGAQAADPASDDGEIVITAEKRADTASRIGMSISVLGGDALTKLRVIEASDLVRQVPGFTITKANSGTPIYTLRGLGFNTPNLSSTSPVGIYVDQVAYAFPYMTSGAVFDISRVEVLKGPQGTLYGRNTTGGLVNFITNRPTDEAMGSLTVEAGNYESFGVRGFVSGPITATLKGRFAFQTDLREQGWQKSVSRHERLGKANRKAARGILQWDPTPEFSATATMNYWRDDSDTQAPQAVYQLSEAPGFETPWPNLPRATRNGFADWTPTSYQPSPNTSRARPAYRKNSEFYSGALQLDYRLTPELTLTSLTAYNHLKRNDAQNNDGVPFERASYLLRGTIKSLSQELRISGEGQGYNWIVGGYFAKDKIDENQLVYLGDFSTINLLRFVAGTLSDPRYSATQIAEGFRVNNQLGRFDNRSISVFANGQYEFTDTLKITGGLRYTEDRSRFGGCAADAEGNTLPVWNTAVALLAGQYPNYNVLPNQCMTFKTDLSGPAGLVQGTLKEDNLSWRVNLNYAPQPGLLFYTAVARGYKSGAFPVIPANKAIQYVPATQEKVTSYEAGSKFRVGPARLSLAAFYNDYRNKQVFGAIEDPIFTSLERLVNVPKSKTWGFEGELDWRITEQLAFHGAASYVRTKVIRYTGYNQFGELLNLAGAEFPNTPRWQLAGNLSYDTPISQSLKLEMVVDAAYQSRSHGDFQDLDSYTVRGITINEPIYGIPGYALANASISLARTDDRWRATLWARNLTGKDYWTSINYSRDGIIRFSGMPRTYGASLTFNF